MEGKHMLTVHTLKQLCKLNLTDAATRASLRMLEGFEDSHVLTADELKPMVLDFMRERKFAMGVDLSAIVSEWRQHENDDMMQLVPALTEATDWAILRLIEEEKANAPTRPAAKFQATLHGYTSEMGPTDRLEVERWMEAEVDSLIERLGVYSVGSELIALIPANSSEGLDEGRLYMMAYLEQKLREHEATTC
jgi:hypothetical protein